MKRYSNKKYSSLFIDKKNVKLPFKALSAAVLAGTAFLGASNAALAGGSVPEVSAMVADEELTLSTSQAAELLQSKPVETPTLDYLHENNVSASESAYTITKLDTEEGAAFDYITADEDGNLTHNYYKVELKPGADGALADIDIGKSKNISWTEVSAPAGGAELPANTIKVELPNNVVKYYQYTYTSPYPDAAEPIDDTLSTANVNKVTFKGLGSLKSGALYNTKDTKVNIVADFVSNKTGALGGGAIYNSGTIGNITGDFIGNNIAGSGSIQGGAIYNVQNATIGDLVGDFIGNFAKLNTEGGEAQGGAIFNKEAIMGNISGDFINNYAQAGKGSAQGGAIYNKGYMRFARIGNISGDFINNYVKTGSGLASGGAIYNESFLSSTQIGNIDGDFINNYAQTGSGNANGGAIYNTLYGCGSGPSIIGNITGNFIGNHAQGTSGAYGGAISNSNIYGKVTIGNIVGDFINNYAQTGSGNANGGAIHNEQATIENITGDFINNYAQASSGYAQGGAIYNYSYSDHPNATATIGDIVGSFIGNYANSGGAIYNYATSRGAVKIGDIVGDFINNYATTGSGNAQGGAIYNSSNGNCNVTMGNITGSFTDNYAQADKGDAQGGAIYNYAYRTYGRLLKIGNIDGDFINNHATTGSGNAQGGAIYNSSNDNCNVTMGNITGSFTDNYAQADKGDAQGGAIYNYTHDTSGSLLKIGNIDGDFINNHARGTYKGAGGAIFNGGSIGNITGNFMNNYAQADSYAQGGAINNYDNIGNITGNFMNNYVQADSGYAHGGAIANHSWKGSGSYPATMGNITGNFVNNHVQASSGDAQGGAVYNYGSTIGDMVSDFVNNYAKTESGNAEGGAIYNYSWNTSTLAIGKRDKDGNPVGGLINSSFVGNYAKATGENGTAHGGAIWTNVDTNLITKDGHTSVISGNYVEDKDGKRPEAIYVAAPKLITKYLYGGVENGESIKPQSLNVATQNPITLTLSTQDNSTIIIDDEIVTEISNNDVIEGTYYNDSDKGYAKQYVRYDQDKGLYVKIDTPEPSSVVTRNKLELKGDNTGKIVLNNNVKNFDVRLTDANLYLATRDNVLDGNTLTLNRGFMSMINNKVGVSALEKLTVTGNTNLVADVDLKNKEMDRFTANSYGEHGDNMLNVTGMNLLTDAKQDETVTAVYFAQPGLKNNVSGGTLELPQEKYQKFEAYTPIYKYNIIYDNEHEYDGKGDGGYFVFTKGDKYFRPSDMETITPTPGGSTGNPSDAFNPAVLTTPINTVAASQAGMTEAFKYVFEHIDAFTQLPATQRMAKVNANKYALVENDSRYNGVSTDFNRNLGSFNYDEANKALWVRPYATFEKMDLKNGPDVDMITYGTLVGYDGNFKDMRHGWHRVGTAYLGYNGAQIHYKGADTTTNGGLLGMTETYYKGNFWSALTLSAGASVGETRTMYGKEDYATLLAGAASKTGYNFEFKEGRYIFQPVMYMSYTFANTFDYTNAAGVHIDTKPAHAIQLHPMIRGVMNCKNGWQPYAQFGVVWNALNKSHITANGVRLPEMSMKPYVEYGVGVQRNWDDKYTAFGQAMVRNGGRNGVALTFGFRWALDRKQDKVEKQKDKLQAKVSLPVHTASVSTPTRTIIKQMSDTQRTALLANKLKNTTITSNKIVMKSL